MNTYCDLCEKYRFDCVKDPNGIWACSICNKKFPYVPEKSEKGSVSSNSDITRKKKYAQ